MYLYRTVNCESINKKRTQNENKETMYNGSSVENSTQGPYSGIHVAQPSFWSIVVFIVVMVIIMVLALLGNSVILVTELFNKQKTSTDWLVTFMSANDLILACNVPIYILFYSGSWEMIGSNAMCGFMVYIQETFSYSSCILLTVTAIDRYVKTCRPHATGITPRRAGRICFGVTAFTFGINFIIPFYMVYDADLKCTYVETEGAIRTLFRVIVSCIQATFVVMFVTVMISYCKVALTIRARVRALVKSSRLEGESLDTDKAAPDAKSGRHRLTDAKSRSLRHNKIAPQPSTSNGNKNTSTDVQTAQTSVSTNSNTSPGQVFTVGQITSLVDENPLKDDDDDDDDTNTTGVVKDLTVENNDTVAKVVETEEPKRQRKRHRNAINASKPRPSPREIQMNRTTAIMFAVTVVFVLSWIPPWVVASIWPYNVSITVRGSVAILFGRRSFMVNTCTNPFFYIGMSSLFRQRAKQTLARLWYRLLRSLGNNPEL